MRWLARIRDVAREAGVSVGTVSMVLNHADYGSPAIRQKVESAVEKLQYVPSEMARNLSLKRTMTVGIIVPTVSHPFFAELVGDLEEALYHLGYKTMLCCTRQKENAEHVFLEMLQRQNMDGIIMGAHSLDTAIYQGVKQPIIAFDRYLSPDIPIVHTNHVLGGEMAAQAFLQHDCHHIVEISGSQMVKTPAGEYHQAFNKVMQAHGVRTDVVALPWNSFGFKESMELAERIFDEFPDVDGILGSDVSVSSCLQLAVRRGIKVPEQLKLVAYDGTYITQNGILKLTAVRQPIAELAEIAAKKIVSLINGSQDDSPWVLPPTVLKGETC
ncbi:LacI family DNA-binding transcriptional regulator [Selenomonas sp. ND2010]|uniref:LacI family DNA-binding transcriptional regulator n=1 Tax=Selenomonas sp. ND2010 TaxID=1410618 RepID=UPI001E5A290D|nr:LacI family DNA-binding transcriptional regulator [Selenomonas sp. ND2010]